MKARLLALLLGLALIAVGYLFRVPPTQQAAAPVPAAEEEEPESSGRPANPMDRPPLIQTAAFHPSAELLEERDKALPNLNQGEASTHWNAIAVLVTCASSPDQCMVSGLPDTDPSARFFSLRDRILDELDWYASHRTSPSQSASVVQAAHSLLAIPDDQVQCRSVDLLLAQPANTKTPELIARYMSDLVDASCVENVVKVLRKSLDSANSRTVTDYVCSTILYGATFTSKEMAKNLPGILTEETRGPLESCLAKLPKGERYHSMRNALFPAI